MPDGVVELSSDVNVNEKVSQALMNFWATLLSLVLHGGFQPVGISIHVQYMAAEGQPVNQGCYHCGVLKQIRPIVEFLDISVSPCIIE